MCQDPHGPGGDPDRAGTPNWAASQIPLDDQGRHTRRPTPGPRGHNIPPKRGGWGGMWFAALRLALVLLACHDGPDDPPDGGRDEDLRKLLARQRKALNARIDEERDPRRPPWLFRRLVVLARSGT